MDNEGRRKDVAVGETAMSSVMAVGGCNYYLFLPTILPHWGSSLRDAIVFGNLSGEVSRGAC